MTGTLVDEVTGARREFVWAKQELAATTPKPGA